MGKSCFYILYSPALFFLINIFIFAEREQNAISHEEKEELRILKP